jgi:hypothetical protein
MEANTEKYKRIIESTIIECNRVLDIWQKERKTTFYGAEESMFRGYLSRFVRHEFGHKYGIRVSNTNPYCVILNNKIVDITLHNIPSNYYSYSKELNGLCDYVRDFSFEAFYEKYKDYEEYVERQSQLSDLDKISFDDIKKINF